VAGETTNHGSLSDGKTQWQGERKIPMMNEDDRFLFMQRVIDEKRELDGKIERLLAFIGTKIFAKLPAPEQKRLRRQEVLMELYSEVLAERIHAFPKGK
jgi:hypothetical protein